MHQDKVKPRVQVILIACLVAGAAEVVALGSLRVSGLLSGEDYSWVIILSWPVLLVFLPGMWWFLGEPRTRKSFGLGFAVLFVLILVIVGIAES